MKPLSYSKFLYLFGLTSEISTLYIDFTNSNVAKYNVLFIIT